MRGTHEIFPSFRLRVPQVKLFPDEFLNDGRKYDVAENEPEDGEDEARDEEADAALAAAVHLQVRPAPVAVKPTAWNIIDDNVTVLINITSMI